MSGSSWVDMKKKNTHLEEEEGRAEHTVAICVIRSSVSLSTEKRGWTTTEPCLNGLLGNAKTQYLIIALRLRCSMKQWYNILRNHRCKSEDHSDVRTA